MSIELTKPRRIELILRQIDALPTLPAIATRLLSLTASEDAHARQVVELVSADPALTARVISMVRAADKGVFGREDVATVERAVVLLGFKAVRNAVLSLKVLELFDEAAHEHDAAPQHAGDDPPLPGLDRQGHWLHSLAVAIAAERIAAAHRGQRDLPADEAFVCGLLHGIGKLALDMVLPRSYARVIEMTERHRGNIAEFERKIIGIDHHTAGKRLAEQWGLPHRLQDCIWLHGASFDTLPRLEHRRLVGLVGLAELLVRRLHIGYSGNHAYHQDPDEIAGRIGLDPQRVREAVSDLHEQLEQRGKAMGIHNQPSRELVIESIQRANQALGRLNQALDQRSRDAAAQARVIETIARFHMQATPGRSVQDVLDAVGESARQAFGPGFYALLYPCAARDAMTLSLAADLDHQAEHDRAWLITQYTPEGEPARAQYIAPPAHSPDLAGLDPNQPNAIDLMAVLPWISDYLVAAEDVRQVRLLPLGCGWGTSALLLHDRASLPPWRMISSLTSAWGSAVAAAAQHDGARRLSEQLAESNAALARAQDKLLRQEAMARLGEMAAGAAHEMNNPLAVISGRSQLLSMSLDTGSKEQKAAQTIYREAHRLSDLITALHMYADPPRADRKPTDLGALIQEVVQKVRQTHRRRESAFDLNIKLAPALPTLLVDADHIGRALTELLLNALQANPKASVTVRVEVDQTEQRLLVHVTDDGDGMDAYTLAHAMDPFFSSKPAGRRVGMGLPRAAQLINAHEGELRLRSRPGEGTTATIALPLPLNAAAERVRDNTAA